jgi:hypothetical protein
MKKFELLFHAVVLWAMGPCSLLGWYQHFRDICCLHLQESWWEGHFFPAKYWYECIRLHDVINHKTAVWIFIAVETSIFIYLTSYKWFFMKNKLYVNSVKTSLELYIIVFLLPTVQLTTHPLELRWHLALVLLPTSSMILIWYSCAFSGYCMAPKNFSLSCERMFFFLSL